MSGANSGDVRDPIQQKLEIVYIIGAQDFKNLKTRDLSNVATIPVARVFPVSPPITLEDAEAEWLRYDAQREKYMKIFDNYVSKFSSPLAYYMRFCKNIFRYPKSLVILADYANHNGTTIQELLKNARLVLLDYINGTPASAEEKQKFERLINFINTDILRCLNFICASHGSLMLQDALSNIDIDNFDRIEAGKSGSAPASSSASASTSSSVSESAAGESAVTKPASKRISIEKLFMDCSEIFNALIPRQQQIIIQELWNEHTQQRKELFTWLDKYRSDIPSNILELFKKFEMLLGGDKNVLGNLLLSMRDSEQGLDEFFKKYVEEQHLLVDSMQEFNDAEKVILKQKISQAIDNMMGYVCFGFIIAYHRDVNARASARTVTSSTSAAVHTPRSSEDSPKQDTKRTKPTG